MYWDKAPFTASCFNNIVEKMTDVGYTVIGTPSITAPPTPGSNGEAANIKIEIRPKVS
jgi:hypothetical protein